MQGERKKRKACKRKERKRKGCKRKECKRKGSKRKEKDGGKQEEREDVIMTERGKEEVSSMMCFLFGLMT